MKVSSTGFHSMICSFIVDMTLEGIQAFIPQFWSQIHIESLMHGNLTQKVNNML